MLSGTFFPRSLPRSGFGSNVSRWLGPPPIQSRMTLFARPRFNDTGRSCAKSFRSSASIRLSATEPSPIPAWRSRSRRLSVPQGSFDIDELVQVEERVTQRGQVELLRRVPLHVRRRPPQRDFEGAVDAARPLRKSPGTAEHEGAVQKIQRLQRHRRDVPHRTALPGGRRIEKLLHLRKMMALLREIEGPPQLLRIRGRNLLEDALPAGGPVEFAAR